MQHCVCVQHLSCVNCWQRLRPKVWEGQAVVWVSRGVTEGLEFMDACSNVMVVLGMPAGSVVHMPAGSACPALRCHARFPAEATWCIVHMLLPGLAAGMTHAACITAAITSVPML
jgi:hypothetical protein